MQIMFVLVDSAEDNLAKPFLTLFGIESEKQVVSSLVPDSVFHNVISNFIGIVLGSNSM